jgi:Pyruvate/2-oxoacid:ferredoxin oxidoreductase delta subunit/flavodoxin
MRYYNILIHYFSGTGNTAYVVNFLKSEFMKNNITVNLYFIGRDQFSYYENIDYHIFCFPVYAWSAPVHYKNYINNLKVQNPSDCAIISVGGATSPNSMGFGGQANIQINAMLKEKGFNPTYTNEVYLPDNWVQFTNPPSSKEIQEIFTLCNSSLQKIALEIMQEQHQQLQIRIFDIIWSKIISFLYGIIRRRALGKIFIADDKCGACGLCAKNCPSQSIQLKGFSRKFPIWDFNCIGCNRCMNVCPDKAIQMSFGRSIVALVSFAFFILFLNPMISLVYTFFQIPYNDFLESFIKTFIGLLIVILFHIFYFTIADSFIGFIQQFPPFRKFFLLNWTSGFRRYKVSGINFKKQKN